MARSLGLSLVPILLTTLPGQTDPATAADSPPRFDLDHRRQTHWSWRAPMRPTLPQVTDPLWAAQPIDRLVYQAMRQHGLKPAAPAHRTTLLRRISFDLTGLPPSLAEQDTFLADHSRTAYADLVDRLLASERFGEHWARHWLDLVRYADSLGHEFDYSLPNAYRYRDYVIRAFNQDLPYDQFVREQIAGDLLPTPRRDAQGHNESAVGTGFYWLGEQPHSPVDVRKHTADRTDNQIDVLSKTFLGLTVSCARCHDHKFDAISTADYYALSGFLKSSRFAQIDSSPPRSAALIAEFLRTRKAYHSARIELATKQLPSIRQALLDAALADPKIARDPEHPMHGIALAQRHPNTDIRTRWLAAAAPPSTPPAESTTSALMDFRKDDYKAWFVQGQAFGDGPLRKPMVQRRARGGILVQAGGWAYSGRRGLHAQGVLRSKTFTITRRYLHIYAFGRESRIRVVLEGFNLIRDPIYGQLHRFINHEAPRWYTIPLSMWQGRRAFLALNDQQAGGLADPSRPGGYAADGYLAVQQGWFSDSANPPSSPAAIAAWLLGPEQTTIDTLDKLADCYQRAITEALTALRRGKLHELHASLLNWLWDQHLLGDESPEDIRRRQRLEQIEASIGHGRHSPGMVDGTGEDQQVFIRGGHNSPGELVPRRILEGLGGTASRRLQASDGSGRRQLAEQILDPDNPYPARVLVNRLWHHLFGRGIVRTVDNFGVLGARPSHPQLLDWLALRLRDDGWSIKQTIRRMVLSQTYRQASTESHKARQKDPTNQYLSHASVRRRTGESIRDSILMTSGRLDLQMYGPGVPVHLDAFTEGRGRPRSGPLDGNGRRSIYLQLNRNFMSSFLLAFDLPRPALTRGRRNVTNVPAQALAMLNDTFVKTQAARWATRIMRANDTTIARIDSIYRHSLARRPTDAERRLISEFLAEHCASYRCKLSDPRPWQDLCHAMFNVKEFLFLR